MADKNNPVSAQVDGNQVDKLILEARIDELNKIYHSREVMEGSLAKVLMVIAAKLKELKAKE